MRAALALAALLAAGQIAAAPLDVIRQCAQSAPVGVSGIKDLEASCPGLAAAISDLGLADLLFAGAQEKLSAAALHDVIQMTEYYARPIWHAPDTRALAGILASLTHEQAPPPKSWWQSIKTWLKHWLDNSHSPIANWLRHALDRWLAQVDVSESVLQLISYCLIGLVALAAITVVFREIRAARVLRRTPDPRIEPQTESASTNSLDLFFATDSPDSLTELLRVLVRKLLQTGRLKAERSLTHRELIARSRFENTQQREAFAAVASGAEAIFYGPYGRAPDALAETKRRGEALLAQLAESNIAS